MKNQTKKYDILSPDGFTMFMDEDFNSPEEAEAGFDRWKQRFVSQGFYSSNRGRIPVRDLRKHCELISYEA